MAFLCEDLWLCLYAISGVAAVCTIIFYVILRITTTVEPDLTRAESEKTFKNEKGEDRPFPSIGDPPSVYLSLVVPAYKEESRLPVMMQETMTYLKERQKENPTFSYEIIIVNDGSPDNTYEVAYKYVQEYGSDCVRVLNFVKNRGKGGAVRLGCLSARGEKILFVDADGATRISDVIKLEKAIDKLAKDHSVPAICVGSRAHLQDEAVANRTFLRNFLMYGFHFVVYILCVQGIKDTQCGFKMCTRAAVEKVFKNLHIERWAFDVEMLYIAQYLKIPISEEAVNWQEIDGSKMVPILSWLEMGRDLLFIRLRYLFRIWRIKQKHS